MRRVTIMRGIPGSGKTTVCKKELEFWKEQGNTTAYCSADDFHVNKDGVYKFNFKLAGNAHIYCMDKFLEALDSAVEEIFVDNTNTQVFEYTPYLQVALAKGYKVRILEVECNLSVAFERQTHGVPMEHHLRMHNRFEKALPFHKQYVRVIKNDK